MVVGTILRVQDGARNVSAAVPYIWDDRCITAPAILRCQDRRCTVARAVL
jgi:hypothetical protein